MRLFAIVLFLAACGSEPERPGPVAAVEIPTGLVEYAEGRLFDRFVEDGQVVSRRMDGALDARGDSPLYTGIAIGSLDCEKGAPLMARLKRRIAENDGKLERFEPWDDTVGGNRWSWDQEVGVTYAFARRAVRCPDESVSTALHWNIRQEAISRFGGRLHPEVDQGIPPAFDFVQDAVSHRLGLGGAPHPDRQRLFELAAISWTAGVAAAKSECYRIHLAFRSLLTAEAVGRPIGGYGRSRFCHHTRRAQIPTIDRWCGRPETYVRDFYFNAWHFRHDHCSWQSGPTGTPDVESPAVDLLDYVAQATNQ